ncbi:MAG: DUF2680 domain-containing protein [Saccharofermentanales bacterium]
MKKFKTLTAIGATVLAISAISFTAFAASTYSSPAQAVAGLTGRTEESVIAQKTESGDTYGTIAKEAGKLEEFKDEMLEIKKDALAERVKAGTMTQEQADLILKNIEENQATCDGTGSARIGQKSGAGFGRMNGQGQGAGTGRGQGNGR